MGRVFLSYARDDLRRATNVAQALEAAGHEVWWDSRLKGGSEYSREIDEALKSAEAVVVLWSKTSVNSEWVRDEATTGKQRGRLVPASIDGSEPPLGFRQHHTIDLSGRGSGARSALQTLLDAVEAAAGPSEARVRAPSGLGLKRLSRILVGLALVAVAVAVVLFWRPWDKRAGVPIVAVAAAGVDKESAEWSRDLLVKLGQLQAAKAETVKLIDGAANSAGPDLIFEIAGPSGAMPQHANLMLLAGKDRTLLWSRDFEAERDRSADLKQRLALNAARVLGCALEGMAADRKRLPEQTLKLYLTGCAEFADVAGFRTQSVVPIFLRVTQQAPNFEPGWAKLLISEANTLLYSEAERAGSTELRKHIDAARNVAPNIPEADLAEMALTPPGAFGRRMALIDKAITKDPDNPWLLSARGLQNTIIGRLNDAVRDTRKTAALDPLSPAAVNSHISVLAYSGRPDAAFAELRRAEQAWPGSTVLVDARYRLLVRFGKPREALDFASSEAIQRQARRSQEALLSARLQPTPENIDRAIADAKAALAANPRALRVLVQTYAEVGKDEEIYGLLMRPGAADPRLFITDTFFRPALRNFRRDLRFMMVAARFGLVRFWQESGKWPDFCFEADLPYDCKQEAARRTR